MQAGTRVKHEKWFPAQVIETLNYSNIFSQKLEVRVTDLKTRITQEVKEEWQVEELQKWSEMVRKKGYFLQNSAYGWKKKKDRRNIKY